MLSANKIKLIRSLDTKKKRNSEGLFVAEGEKLVLDLMSRCDCHFVAGEKNIIDSIAIPENDKFEATASEMKKASFMTTPSKVIGVFRLPIFEQKDLDFKNGLFLCLDGVRDPGNMGTIIRNADWFGIDAVFISKDCCDAFHPKVVQSSMGSVVSVPVFTADLADLFAENDKMPVYGMLLEGENIYESDLSSNGFLLLGNEGKGISDDLKLFVNKKMTIPSFSETRFAESLNVASASAIICSEFRRRKMKK